jgi:hypothetical protein
MCFAMTFELNDFSVKIGKGFVEAGGGVTRPYKLVFTGGPGRHPPLKIDL